MISFIIPLYNKSRYIKKCITSVLASTTSKEIEIVVVDDCSTDNSIEVVKSIKDERVKLIALSENRGPSAARNVGAKNAKNDYLFFLDADDYVSDNLTSYLVHYISNYPSFMVFSVGIRYAKNDDNWVGLEQDVQNHGMLPCFAYHQSVLEGSLLLTASNVCLHKGILDEVGLFREDSRYSEDAEFWARLSAKYPVYSISKLLVHYRVLPDSLSQVGASAIRDVPIFLITLKEQALKYRSKKCRMLYSKMLFKYFFLSKRTNSSISKTLLDEEYIVECNIKYRAVIKVLNFIPGKSIGIVYDLYRLMKYGK